MNITGLWSVMIISKIPIHARKIMPMDQNVDKNVLHCLFFLSIFGFVPEP